GQWLEFRRVLFRSLFRIQRSTVDVAQALDFVGRFAAPNALKVVDALDAKEPYASDFALEHDGGFPQPTPSVHPAADFEPAIFEDGFVVGRAKQDVVDALGVGLHVTTEALEHLRDGGAGLARPTACPAVADAKLPEH